MFSDAVTVVLYRTMKTLNLMHLITADQVRFSFSLTAVKFVLQHMTQDKTGSDINIFLISPGKHMLWVFIRSVSVRHFL